jgi:hypothetical protein
MNTLSTFKKITGAILIGFCFSGSVLAQQQSQGLALGQLKPNPVAAPLPQPPLPYPSITWPYGLPQTGAGTIPTIDQNAALYLPYLPWIGQNLAILADYAGFSYKVQMDQINGNSSPYKIEDTVAANKLLTKTKEQNIKAAADQTTSQIQKQLVVGANQSNPEFAKLALIPGTDKLTPDVSDQQFNVESLLSVTGYSNDANSTNNADIDHLIMFLTHLTQAYPPIQFNPDPTKLGNELNREDVKQYLVTLRTLTAMQSVALSNFNYLAKERAIIPGLGKQIGMPEENASQLQVEKYLIDKRLNDPNWYGSMNNASHGAISRETLFIMAEMQRQLFELRMLNERLLATMTTMQMSMTELTNSRVKVQADNINTALKKDQQAASP